MHYWREHYFSDLKAVADVANATANWKDYGSFCLEYERGLRHKAFAILQRFIDSMEVESFNERRLFVSWLMSAAYGREARHMLIPHPLKIRIVEPTLLEWTVVEPTCSEPHRWLGGFEHLEIAIELDPADQIALKEFVICLLSQVDYSTHDLPIGYVGSALNDLGVLQRAETLLACLSNEMDKQAYASDIQQQRELINKYLRKRNRPA